jgi:L-alanine-DL-glutamate epimerase-like enolase superfamily enzyme
VYASTLFRDTPEQMRRAARSYVDRGFRAIKFGWGSWGRDAERDRQLLAAARAEVGPDVRLMVDGYIAGGARAARRHLQEVADLGLEWAEEPLPADQPEALAALGREVDVPIATGEQLGGLGEFRELLRSGGIGVVQPDLSRCGGLTPIREIAALAAEHGALLVPHAWTSHLLTATALHVNAWLPGPVWGEFNVSSSAITRELVTGLEMVDGKVRVPDAPGLGVTVDEAVLERYRVA